MIRKVRIEEKRSIIDYIGEEYNKCLYLYLDFIKYEFTNENVCLWIQESGNNIETLILTYYSGMHVYSRNMNFQIDELIEFINNQSPSMICGTKEIIKILEDNIKTKTYLSEYGWVRELKNIDEVNYDSIEKAVNKDFKEIATLLYQDDDIGSSYTIDELEFQIKERNNEQYGRNYIIRDNNVIVCHAGTGAENEKVAILNYVITLPSYRHKGLASRLCKAVCKDLITEGKTVYLINYSKESTALYDKIGFKISCEWGKLYKDLKSEDEKDD